MRLLRPILILTAAALMLPALAQPVPVQAAPFQGSNPGLTGSQPDANANNAPITGKPAQQSSVIDYVNSAYQFMAIVGGLLAILMLIYAGYRYMTSYGDPEKISDAKDVVEKALIGLSLLILAALILNTINPRTSQEPCVRDASGNFPAGCGTIDFSKPKG